MSVVAKRVRTDLLDCIQVNLAALVAQTGDPDRYLALGSALRFNPRPGSDGLPTIDPPVEQHVAKLTGQVGLKQRTVGHDLRSNDLRALVEGAGVVYAVGDSFDMSWLPYAGHSHMEHSFLVIGPGKHALVQDAYDNETTWGPARPGAWTIPWAQLPVADSAIVFAVSDEYLAPAPSLNLDDPTAYLEAYAQADDPVLAARRLTTETWLMSRARQLHAAYRESLGEHLEAEDHLHRWNQLAVQAFIALRRVERGQPAPGMLLSELGSLLAADRGVFETPGDSGVT